MYMYLAFDFGYNSVVVVGISINNLLYFFCAILLLKLGNFWHVCYQNPRSNSKELVTVGNRFAQ